ncbi:CAZyme family CE10 [Penicillium tannophilum]|nr:CAZyme family CE10 [Penicillium tannophilum]
MNWRTLVLPVSSIILIPSVRSLALVPALIAAAVVDLPTINTTYGKIRGAASPFREGVTVYKGIPFATPPTGARRWTPPVKPASWSGVLNATEFGPYSLLSAGSTRTSASLVGLVYGVISESGARGPYDPATSSVATSYNTKEEAESFGVTFFETMNVTSIAELRELSMATLIGEG